MTPSPNPPCFPLCPQSLRESSLNEVEFIQQGRHIAQHGRGACNSNAAIRTSRVGGPAPDTDGKRRLLRFLLTLRFWQSQVKFQSHPTSPEVNAGVSTESLRCKHPSSLGTTRLFKSILASPKSPPPSWGGGFEMESQALKTDRQRTGQARSPKATGCGQVKQEKAI